MKEVGVAADSWSENQYSDDSSDDGGDAEGEAGTKKVD